MFQSWVAFNGGRQGIGVIDPESSSEFVKNGFYFKLD